jgi:hypothetical protein
LRRGSRTVDALKNDKIAQRHDRIIAHFLI